MKSKTTKKLAMAGVFTALAVVGSMLSVPVASSKCAPVQHMINILSAVLLGPGYSVGIAFVASLLRNILGLGSFLAFPGSMVGALCCGLVYKFSKKVLPTCVAEAFGTGVLGGKICDGTSGYRNVCVCCSVSYINCSRKYSCICTCDCT